MQLIKSLLVFVLLPSIAHGAQIKDIKIPYPNDANFQLGQGWNLALGQATRNRCLDPTTYDTPTSQINDKYEHISQGNNNFSLNETLDVSYKESVSENAGIEKANESSNVNMAQSFSMTKDNRYVIVTQRHRTTSNQLLSKEGASIKLSKEHEADRTGNKTKFKDDCGDRYVSAITKGGKQHILFNMHTASYDATASVVASFQESANVGIADESESVQAKTKLHTVTNESNTSISSIEFGAKEAPAGNSVDSVLKNYASFPTRLEGYDREIEITLSPYPDATDLNPNTLGPFGVLAREYAKWQYLYALTGKMIDDSYQASKDQKYKIIDGLSVSGKALNHFQEMAGNKVKVIVKKSTSCIKYFEGQSSLTLEKACSLIENGKSIMVDFVTPEGKKMLVPVAESDIYYLVRLPFSETEFEQAKSQTKNAVYDQVRSIYKGRGCDSAGQGAVLNFCEPNAAIDTAISNYFDNKGNRVITYQQLQNSYDNNKCLVLGTDSLIEFGACSSSNALFFNMDKGVVRATLKEGDELGCVRFQWLDTNRSRMKFYADRRCDSPYKSTLSDWSLTAKNNLYDNQAYNYTKDNGYEKGNCLGIHRTGNSQMIITGKCVGTSTFTVLAFKKHTQINKNVE